MYLDQYVQKILPAINWKIDDIKLLTWLRTIKKIKPYVTHLSIWYFQ